MKDKRFIQQISTRDGAYLVSFAFIMLVQQVQMVLSQGLQETRPKNGTITYDKSHHKTVTTRYYHTTYHPHVVVLAFCIPLEVSLQFFFHPSLDTVNHLNRAGNDNILSNEKLYRCISINDFFRLRPATLAI